MILTCPACASRYFVEDSRLGANGRTVRCAACGSSWRAMAEEPLELMSSPEEGATAGREPLSFKPPTEDAAPLTAPELPKAFRAKAEQRRRIKQAATAGAVWAGMGSAFAALLVAAFVFRVDIVKLYPRAAGAYAFARVPVNPTGLEFEGVKAEPAAGEMVLVSGALRNVEDSRKAAPPVRVTLLDGQGKKLATRTITPDATPLAPGKTRAFSVMLPDPRAAAGDVSVEFVLDAPAPKAARPAQKAPPKAAPKAAPPAAPKAAAAPPPATPAVAGPAATPATAAALRPAVGAPAPAPVEARPLGENDPFALDVQAGRTVSGAATR